MAKKEQCTKFKKAPQAPRRFKSAYMFFSTEKHKSIREEHGKKLQTTHVAKMVSQAWKNLPPEEREEWEEMARRDKARFEVEKSMYTGPWKIPATKSRSHKKDPNAPKRPMSAFLSYSNSKRAAVKSSNPSIGNAEVSRILAKMWKEAPEEERKMHIEREFELRKEYKSAIAIWRQNADEEFKAARKRREDIALQRVDEPPENNLHHQASIHGQGCSGDQTSMGRPGEPTEPLDRVVAQAKRPPLPGRGGGGSRPSPPYNSMGHFGGMNFNNATGNDCSHQQQHLSPHQYASFAPSPPPRPPSRSPPETGAADTVGGDDPIAHGGSMEIPSAAYGMDRRHQAVGGPYPEDYWAESGVPCNAFEQGYNANFVGLYSAYCPPAPQNQMRMSQPDYRGMPWGNQYYGNRNGEDSSFGPDGSSGTAYDYGDGY